MMSMCVFSESLIQHSKMIQYPWLKDENRSAVRMNLEASPGRHLWSPLLSKACLSLSSRTDTNAHPVACDA